MWSHDHDRQGMYKRTVTDNKSSQVKFICFTNVTMSLQNTGLQ